MIARAVHAAEHFLDRVFGVPANPLRQLGALAYLFFWGAIASGIYVYLFYDTGVDLTYASVERLSDSPRALSGIMRSVHRYAADAFAFVLVLHALCELAYGRYRGFRWFTWTTGVPLIALALIAGIVGYWLVWDELAQFIAVAAAEWLAVLPGLGTTLVRNFIAPEAVSDRFFSLLVFAHIAVSLLLLLGMWVHVQRIARARVWPHAALACGSSAMLLALAVAKPALSQAEAQLERVAAAPAIDWFYLFPFPLTYATSPESTWVLTAIAAIVLCALPWLTRERRPAAAVVNPDQCNGCARCVADCPYNAVVLTQHVGSATPLARVLPDLCAGCGICVGACPSSNPFRSARDFASGIELPGLTVATLRAQLDAVLARAAPASNIVFACACTPRAHTEREASTTLRFPCIGMLPPSFIDYALRRGAAVSIAACESHDCEFRLGAEWTQDRLNGAREPHLRARSRDRLHLKRTRFLREVALA